jgi:hypothetical protein
MGARIPVDTVGNKDAERQTNRLAVEDAGIQADFENLDFKALA